MPRVVCILVRHGEYQQLANTPSAWQPFPLSKDGESQARECVGRLAEMCKLHSWSVTSVAHSSTLLRAWQTATIVQAELPQLTTIEQTDRLAERSVGGAANLSEEEIARIVDADPRFEPLAPRWKADGDFRLPFPGAESLVQAGRRVACYLREVANGMPTAMDHPQAILFFGHGGAFRYAALELGVLTRESVGGLSMHHARPVALGVGDDGSWRHLAGEWKVRGGVSSG